MKRLDRLERVVTFRSIAVLAVVLAFADLSLTLIFRDQLATRAAFSSIGLIAAGLFSAACVFMAARRREPREINVHLTWTVLAAAQLARTFGDLAAIFSESAVTDRGSLWSLDLIYLLADALFVLGILLLRAPTRSGSERVRTWLDIGILVVAGMLIAWYFLVAPMSSADPAAVWGTAISISYAAMYVVMLFVSLELSIARRTPPDRASILLLSAGVVSRISAGIVSVILCPPRGACPAGNWDSLFWIISSLFVGLAALRYAAVRISLPERGPGGQQQEHEDSVWALYLPYAGVIVAYLLLVYDRGRIESTTSLIMTLGTGLIIVLVIARQIRVVSENLQLYRASQQEVAERKNAEEELRRARDELEVRVRERTAELVQANRSLHAEVEERRRLNEMGEMLQACQTREEAYKVVSRFGGELFPGQAGALCTIDNSKASLETAAVWGESSASQCRCLPGECWALRRGRPHLNAGRSMGTTCGSLDHAVQKSYLCVPMIAQGEAIGVLRLEDLSPLDPSRLSEQLTPADTAREQLASLVAVHVALALKNLGLRDALRNQAIRDPLTGLFNRRYMGETLERELSRAVRKNLPMAIIMFDLDQLKEFNDAFGHAAGDALLRRIGSTLRGLVRIEDVCCRYGGDEFIIILPDTGIEDACKRAEQLRTTLSRLKIEYLGQSLDAVTVSLGVAALPRNGSTAEKLLKAADTALYSAKNDGRDRLMIADPLPA